MEQQDTTLKIATLSQKIDMMIEMLGGLQAQNDQNNKSNDPLLNSRDIFKERKIKSETRSISKYTILF